MRGSATCEGRPYVHIRRLGGRGRRALWTHVCVPGLIVAGWTGLSPLLRVCARCLFRVRFRVQGSEGECVRLLTRSVFY
jgi:hypothetical protein